MHWNKEIKGDSLHFKLEFFGEIFPQIPRVLYWSSGKQEKKAWLLDVQEEQQTQKSKVSLEFL